MSAWLDQVFQADQANNGGVVRRSVDDVLKHSSRNELVTEARQRGFHVVETGDQFVIICNTGELKIHC